MAAPKTFNVKSSDAGSPESTIESADQRGNPNRALNKASTSSQKEPNSSKQVCESTIESANRRNFVKKAVIAATAVGIGGALLKKNVLPESAGSSTAGCQSVHGSVVARCSIVVNNPGFSCYTPNSGSLSESSSPGLIFGWTTCGQGIGSARATGSPNQYGLDFYTNHEKRMSLTSAGNFGIGTCAPNATLCVRGTGAFGACVIVNGDGCNSGASVAPGVIFGGGGSGEGIASDRSNACNNQYGLDFYTGGSKRVSITNSGKVGIGTHSPSSTLCVHGNINAQCGIVGKSSGGSAVKGCSNSGTGVLGQSCTGFGVCGYSNNGTGVRGRGYDYGVYGCSICAGVYGSTTGGVGVKGVAYCGVGVFGSSLYSYGIQAQASNPVIGKFKNNVASGDRTAYIQFETGDSSPIDWNAGVAGSCNVCKIADGSFFIGQSAQPRVVVNTKGNVGIGTTSPQTTLQVKGGMSLQLKTETSCYSMGTSDFAVLANPSSTGKSIKLPAAKNSGMVVYIKNISGNAVTVKPAGSDLIEGASSYPLPSKFSSVTLIAGGGSPGVWYLLSNAT